MTSSDSTPFDAVRSTWDGFASIDPYWAVLSNDRHLGGADLDEFVASGARDVAYCLDLVAPHRSAPVRSAVDFGCGVGRLSVPLARTVEDVVGLDVAEGMLELARRAAAHQDNVSFRRVEGPRLPVDDDAVDLVLSLIVLQHLPTDLAITYLMEFARITRAGGHVVFQIPTRLLRADPVGPDDRRAGITILDRPEAVPAGAASTVRVAVANNSGVTWPAGFGFNLGNHWARDGEVHTLDDGRTEIPYDVAPGQTVEVDLVVHAPPGAGSHVLQVDLVNEMVAWWGSWGSGVAEADVLVLDAGRDDPSPDGPAQPGAAPRIDEAEMPMSSLSPDLVRALFAQLGCTVVAAEADTMAGPSWESTTFVVQVGLPLSR